MDTPERGNTSKENPANALDIAPSRQGTGWKTALLVCGSALLGATAVALWNRRVLTKIQSQAPAQGKTDSGTLRDRHLPGKDFF